MAEPRQFSLTQLQQILNSDDESQANNYISQNIAIARYIPFSLIKRKFIHGPLMMPEMRILILRQGWVEPTINLTPRHFEQGDLVFLGRNGIVEMGRASDDVLGMGLSISDDLFSLAVGSRLPEAFDGHLRDFHIRLQPRDIEFLDSIHHLLYLNTREEVHSAQVTLHLISSFLWHVNHLWTQHEAMKQRTLSHEQRIFSDFIQLVNRHAPSEHQVDFYASKLCLSPRYVSTLIKRVSGRAPKEWIDEALLTHIKIQLIHSDKTVAQISDETNFPNPSFFSKFFKRLTGQTPLEYRS